MSVWLDMASSVSFTAISNYVYFSTRRCGLGVSVSYLRNSRNTPQSEMLALNAVVIEISETHLFAQFNSGFQCLVTFLVKCFYDASEKDDWYMRMKEFA